MKQPIRFLVHGYGTYAIIYRHIIELAKTFAPEVEWSMILPSSHHIEPVSEVLAAENLLCLEHAQSRHVSNVSDFSTLQNYPGSIYADIEVEKKIFKHRPADQQVARALEVYQIYKGFVLRIKPTHILMAHVETFEGKALVAIARELGIPVIIPSDLRNLGGVSFTSDVLETLPAYREANCETIARARQFLSEFRQNAMPAFRPSGFAVAGEEPLPHYQKSAPQRLVRFLKRTIDNPGLFEPALLATSIKYAFPRYLEAIRKFRSYRNGRIYDIAALNELPEKFIYYPLQTSPESSINTPAPYFIDQMRAIDAIRFAMDSDCTLIVKEHWASVGIRPPSFYAELRRRAGVRIANFGLPSLELIKRAQLTISVTGTAVFEAFLLGQPSLALGGCFIAEYLGGVCNIDQLSKRIRHAIDNPFDDEYIVQALAEIYSARYECVFRPADEPGFHGNRPENIKRLLRSILQHVERMERFEEKRAEMEDGLLATERLSRGGR
ncbi:hypothetical protein [Bradyrhizobium sp. G127]|uniref:hypothetical protein n=1 Tax=Bradyrhizobium sp. G127 TaxID=2904800 RepID=UPI001F2DC2D6|nr:hypothetical protein [Bradyrhizobium sp. G127]MCF2524442.1 hypothetical protein [Bradyrhizobium sp. G127]